MNVYDAVRTRLTVRTFKPDPVPDEVIAKLLEAGRLAPSSRNRQPWHFILITDRDLLDEIGRVATSGRFVGDAPMAIAIAMDGADRPDLDAGRALQQIELVAWSEGLGTCFVGLGEAEQDTRLKELLGVPPAFELITVLPLGYRTDDVGSSGRKKNRKPMTEVAHGNRFGQPVELDI